MLDYPETHPLSEQRHGPALTELTVQGGNRGEQGLTAIRTHTGTGGIRGATEHSSMGLRGLT